MTNSICREENSSEDKKMGFLASIEENMDQRYQKARETILQYQIGDFISELHKLPEESKPKKVIIGLYGLTGSGKSTLVNYLKRIAGNGKFVEYSAVGSTSRQGPLLLQCWDLTEKSIIFDTRGLDGLNTDKQVFKSLSEMLDQLSGKQNLGYVPRGSTEEDFPPFQCSLPSKPERIHLPIICLPVNADVAQKRGVNQIIQKLTRLSIFPVLAITKYDLKHLDEKLKDKTEKEIVETVADEVGLSKDDVFVFKNYRSEDEERDMYEETKTLERLHKLFGKAERNMMFKPQEQMPQFRQDLIGGMWCLIVCAVFLLSLYFIKVIMFP